MPDIDFAGLRDATQASFKPDFSGVLGRYQHRRRTRTAGAIAAVAVLAIVVGGGVAIAGVPGGGRVPDGVTDSGGIAGTDPDQLPDFIGTPSPSPTGSAPAPRGGVGAVVAGDVDHLYAWYEECRGGTCGFKLAATEDRGRTWALRPLPVPADSRVYLRAAGSTALLAEYDSKPPFMSPPKWLASGDGGRTWTAVSPGEIGALPAGWRPFAAAGRVSDSSMLAVNPATGEPSELPYTSSLKMANLVENLPAVAGLWVTGFVTERVGKGGRYIPSGSAAEVSRDGGKTWRRSTFPGEFLGAEDTGPAIATIDGETVYAVGRVGDALKIYRSADGGRHWTPTDAPPVRVGSRHLRATVRADGVLLIQAGLAAPESPLMFYVTDNGDTVLGMDPAPGAAAVPVAGGYAQPGWPNDGGCWVSPDGTSWSYVAPPRL